MGKTVIGVDAGISSTKIVTMGEGKLLSAVKIMTGNTEESLNETLGIFLRSNGIALGDVERVMMTGVGSAYVGDKMCGLPIIKVDEFIADATGARFMSGEERMLVVSMGTGTSFVSCDGDDIRHVGGIGMGGGTLQGLAQLLLNTDDVATVAEMAGKGSLGHVNLQIGDISKEPLPGLPIDATASLFGNVKDNASPEDIACGLVRMVLETIGSATMLAAQSCGMDRAVMIGSLTLLPQCRQIFDALEGLYGIPFIIPEHSEFCTAMGATLRHEIECNSTF